MIICKSTVTIQGFLTARTNTEVSSVKRTHGMLEPLYGYPEVDLFVGRVHELGGRLVVLGITPQARIFPKTAKCRLDSEIFSLAGPPHELTKEPITTYRTFPDIWTLSMTAIGRRKTVLPQNRRVRALEPCPNTVCEPFLR